MLTFLPLCFFALPLPGILIFLQLSRACKICKEVLQGVVQSRGRDARGWYWYFFLSVKLTCQGVGLGVGKGLTFKVELSRSGRWSRLLTTQDSVFREDFWRDARWL